MHVIVDVEADGPCPGMYSMIEVGMVVVTADGPGPPFWSTLRPMTDLFVEGALSSIGTTREKTLTYFEPRETMLRAVAWLDEQAHGEKMIFWSDNNGFDWSFWNYYCHYFVGVNPFGFSSRRISDLYSGLTHDLRGGTKWKSLRKTKHSHNALDDAMGNAEAFTEILKRNNLRI